MHLCAIVWMFGVGDNELTSAVSHVAARSIGVFLITRAHDVRFAAVAAAAVFLSLKAVQNRCRSRS